MKNRKILLLGSGAGTSHMIRDAQKRGLYTIVTDWMDIEHSEAKRIADEYWMISFADIDALEEKCRAENISAVVTASSEYATGVMIGLCERLNLPCYAQKDSFYYEKDKAAFKEMCRQSGVLVPKDYKLSDELLEDDLNRIEYPVVVKPIDQCGSKGVFYCNNKEELVEAYKKAKEISDSSKIIVEKKIEGKEFAAYYALADGEVSLLFLHTELAADTENPGSCFVASTVTNCVEDFVAKANSNIIETLKRCGCKEHAAWVQLKQDNAGDFYVFELGYRLGADLVPFEYCHTGQLDLAGWGVECALGIKHKSSDLPKGLEHPMKTCIYSYMINCGISGKVQEIKGVEELKKNENIDIVLDICVGDELQAGGKEIGCVGFCVDTLAEVYRLIDRINEQLIILNEKHENMIYPYMTVERFKNETFPTAYGGGY